MEKNRRQTYNKLSSKMDAKISARQMHVHLWGAVRYPRVARSLLGGTTVCSTHGLLLLHSTRRTASNQRSMLLDQ